MGSRWHHRQIDLFAKRVSSKLPQSMPPIPDSQAWAVDALSLPLEDLDLVIAKLRDYPCRRIILIAPGWPNMPWFWDMVAMSNQILLCLPNLLTQPFIQISHKNLSNLNLHTWLLEPRLSRSKALRQWHQELRLIKEY